MFEIAVVITQIAILIFVVTSMLAMGLSLTIPQIMQPLKNVRLVILALAANFLLSKKPGKIVTNVSTTRAIDDIAKQYNSEVIRTQVGEIHVAKQARAVNAVLAGEGNGGIILPDLHLGRDAPLGLTLILQQLAEYDGTISELFQSLPQYKMVKDRINAMARKMGKNLALLEMKR